MTDEREPYWDYMGRRLREVRDNTFLTKDDLCKKEIAEMQKQAIKQEAERLEGMAEWKARVLGISQEDVI